jgi:hypothetical protein
MEKNDRNPADSKDIHKRNIWQCGLHFTKGYMFNNLAFAKGNVFIEISQST